MPRHRERPAGFSRSRASGRKEEFRRGQGGFGQGERMHQLIAAMGGSAFVAARTRLTEHDHAAAGEVDDPVVCDPGRSVEGGLLRRVKLVAMHPEWNHRKHGQRGPLKLSLKTMRKVIELLLKKMLHMCFNGLTGADQCIPRL